MEGQDLKVGQDDWMAASMAFWVARQVFVAHGGAFEEPSLEPGRSVSHARWRLRLPVAVPFGVSAYVGGEVISQPALTKSIQTLEAALQMEAAGVVGPLQSNGSREVLAPPPS